MDKRIRVIYQFDEKRWELQHKREEIYVTPRSYVNSPIQGNRTEIHINPNGISVLMDVIRSTPVFYSYKDGVIYISDDSDWISQKTGYTDIDEIQALSFLTLGQTLEDKTLIKRIYQVQAGEKVKMDSGIVKNTYMFFGEPTGKIDSLKNLEDEFQKLLCEIFEDFIKSLNKRPVVLFLSGGYDSRLIASMLKLFEYKDTILISYGITGNTDALIARKVATNLGYNWIFVEYNFDKWKKLILSDFFRDYVNYSNNLTSIPHIQELIAVKELKEKGVIPSDSILVAGHSADFLAGSHLNISIKRGRRFRDIIKAIHEKIYILRAGNMPKVLERYIENYIRRISHIIDANIEKPMKEDIVATFEFFDWRERQAKFIVNSVRVYEFLGYEWRLPLWDVRMVKFWNKVPFYMKFSKSFYDDFLESEIFSKLGIDFDKYEKKKFKRKKKMKESIQHFFSNSVVFHELLRLYRRLKPTQADPEGIDKALKSLERISDLHLKYKISRRGYDPNSYVADYTFDMICGRIRR